MRLPGSSTLFMLFPGPCITSQAKTPFCCSVMILGEISLGRAPVCSTGISGNAF